MEIVGIRCCIRPFLAADAPALAAAANDRRVWIQLRDHFPHPYTLADAERYIERVAPLDPPRSFAIVVDGVAAGGVGLQPMTDIARRTAEIGYWLGPAFWGRGAATEAVALVTEWAFNAHGLLRVFAEPFTGNLASRRVLEKAGYSLEGIMKCSAIKDGEVRDQCLYARLGPARTGKIDIRPETATDVGAIEAVTIAAFLTAPHSRHTEQLIVRGLRAAGQLAVSLVAVADGGVIGHVALSPVSISGIACGWFGLGPVSVLPERQRRGIGSGLVRESLRMLRAQGAAGCVVLGDPRYYSRFGFRCDSGIVLPNAPPSHFLALAFNAAHPLGTVTYHEAFNA